MIQGKDKKGADLIDILGKVSEKEKLTGIIIAEKPGANISSKVFIKDGQVVYATSTMYRSRFGDLMIKKGIITPKELQAALRLQKENPGQGFIGEILVGMGVISERVIPNLLYHQIEVVIYEVLSWQSANISFDQVNIDQHPEYKRPVANIAGKVLHSDLNKLIDTGSFINALETNLEPLLKIRDTFSDPDAVPKRIMKSYPNQLTFDQRKILRAVDGTNSLNDIIVLSDLDYFRSYKIIFDLAEEKVIGVPGVKFGEDEETSHPVVIDNDSPIISSRNPIESELIRLSTAKTEYAPAKEEPVQDATDKSPADVMLKYQQQYLASREEIRQLQYKINDYENSKLVLSEDVTVRAGRLPYHKKVMLNSIFKNILDMVESI
jgi:hypothetical protein